LTAEQKAAREESWKRSIAESEEKEKRYAAAAAADAAAEKRARAAKAVADAEEREQARDQAERARAWERNHNYLSLNDCHVIARHFCKVTIAETHRDQPDAARDAVWTLCMDDPKTRKLIEICRRVPCGADYDRCNSQASNTDELERCADLGDRCLEQK
jgi:hypothetical protein